NGAGPRPQLIIKAAADTLAGIQGAPAGQLEWGGTVPAETVRRLACDAAISRITGERSEEHTSELQSPCNLVCRLLRENKKALRREAPAVGLRVLLCAHRLRRPARVERSRSGYEMLDVTWGCQGGCSAAPRRPHCPHRR